VAITTLPTGFDLETDGYLDIIHDGKDHFRRELVNTFLMACIWR